MDNQGYTKKLPSGWFESQDEKLKSLQKELELEVPTGHILYNSKTVIIAYREGTDDVLCRHIDEPERFTVVHLSWSMKKEMTPSYPRIEMDGSFNDFFDYENSLFR